MFLKIEPPPLDLKDPWKEDLFKREPFAATLCGLLKNTFHSSVIGISAPFGFGKTFFLLRLREQIKNERGWVVYVNAWEYDYLDNAMFALLDALKSAAGEISNKKEAQKTLKDLGKAVAPIIASAAGRRLLEKIVGEEGSEQLSEVFSEVSGKSAEVLVSRYLKEETTSKTLSVLREKMRNFIAGHLNEDSPYKSLTIIVDELDRAKPSYAIRFLETIKHVFTESKVVFVIGCDRSVLISSAKHEYGASLPVDGYLRRLFDYWIDLPSPNAKQYVSQCAKRLNLFTDGVFSKNGAVRNDIDGYADLLLLGHGGEEDASLRFIEQSVAHAGVTLRLVSTDRLAGLVGWLQGLRHFSPELYKLYVSNKKISDIYFRLAEYAPFVGANDSLKAWIIVWACNSKEALTGEVLARLFGQPSSVVEEINRVIVNSGVDFDDRESMASRIDRRMRTITIHT